MPSGARHLDRAVHRMRCVHGVPASLPSCGLKQVVDNGGRHRAVRLVETLAASCGMNVVLPCPLLRQDRSGCRRLSHGRRERRCERRIVLCVAAEQQPSSPALLSRLGLVAIQDLDLLRCRLDYGVERLRAHGAVKFRPAKSFVTRPGGAVLGGRCCRALGGQACLGGTSAVSELQGSHHRIFAISVSAKSRVCLSVCIRSWLHCTLVSYCS